MRPTQVPFIEIRSTEKSGIVDSTEVDWEAQRRLLVESGFRIHEDQKILKVHHFVQPKTLVLRLQLAAGPQRVLFDLQFNLKEKIS